MGKGGQSQSLVEHINTDSGPKGGSNSSVHNNMVNEMQLTYSMAADHQAT